MYNYQDLRAELFTDDGQKLFIAVRDYANKLLKQAGAFRMQELMHGHGGLPASTWHVIACIDRMVELNELEELTGKEVCGQYRVFVSTRYE